MKIKRDTSVDSLIGLLQQTPVPCETEGWWCWQNVHEAHRRIARAFIDRIPPYPGGYHGRGIVIAAGGNDYFTGAYVNVRALRHVGCRLPVQFWHYEGEIDDAMRRIVAPMGVECIDASRVAETLPGRDRPLEGGWELKPFAMLHSPFRRSCCSTRTTSRCSTRRSSSTPPEYRETGAIFWPDYGRLEPWYHIWSICEVLYRDEPEFESGQIVVNKARCWEALNLAMHYNDHSDFYYQHIHGDKETFRFAFRRLGKSYSMPEHPIHPLDGTMCQHDFRGRRVFQHRNMDKWKLDGSNRTVADFRLEEECRGFLSELRGLWSGHAYWNVELDEHEAAVRAGWPARPIAIFESATTSGPWSCGRRARRRGRPIANACGRSIRSMARSC